MPNDETPPAVSGRLFPSEPESWTEKSKAAPSAAQSVAPPVAVEAILSVGVEISDVDAGDGSMAQAVAICERVSRSRSWSVSKRTLELLVSGPASEVDAACAKLRERFGAKRVRQFPAKNFGKRPDA